MTNICLSLKKALSDCSAGSVNSVWLASWIKILDRINNTRPPSGGTGLSVK